MDGTFVGLLSKTVRFWFLLKYETKACTNRRKF